MDVNSHLLVLRRSSLVGLPLRFGPAGADYSRTATTTGRPVQKAARDRRKLLLLARSLAAVLQARGADACRYPRIGGLGRLSTSDLLPDLCEPLGPS